MAPKPIPENVKVGLSIYLLPAIIITLALIGLILASISWQKSSSFSNNVNNLGGTVMTSIASVNGWTSTSTQGNEAVLSTTVPVNSILAGAVRAGTNILTAASSTQITSATLTGFSPDLSGTPIVPVNTLLTGLEKAVVLNQTVLGGSFAPQAGHVNSQSTVIKAIQSIAGNLVSNGPFLFSALGPSTVLTPLPTSLWSAPFFGSLNVAPLTGTAVEIITYGIILNTTANATFNMLFYVDGHAVEIDLPCDPGVSGSAIQISSYIMFDLSASPVARCYHTASLLTNGPSSVTSITVPQTVAVNTTNVAFDVQGAISAGANMSFVTQNAMGKFLYQSIES